MSNSQNQDIDPELLIRYLSGDANEQDRNEVFRWINASDRHKQYLEEMIILWESSSNAKDFTAIDLTSDWQKVKSRISDRSMTRGITHLQQQKSILYRFARIAAVAVIAAGLYFTIPMLSTVRTKSITAVSINNPTQIVLPDGSKVHLNRHSSIIYPETFGGRKREVSFKGEAFFEISKDEDRPFLIKSGHSITEVVGTSFNLNNTDSAKVVVTLMTGKVLLYDEFSSSKKIALAPGEQGEFEQGKSLSKRVNTDSNVLSWRTGTLTFTNTPLSEVVKELNKHYNQHIELDSPGLYRCTITTTFQHQTIEEVFSEMQFLLPIKVQRNGNKSVITGSGCDPKE